MRRSSILIIAIIALLGIWGFQRGDLSLRRGQGGLIDTSSITRNRTAIIDVQGKLITTPHLEKHWIDTISQTESFIKGQVYNLTNRTIKGLLSDLASKGITIQMILENRQFRSFKDTFNQVKEEFADYPNVQFKSDENLGISYVHSKFRVTDKHAIIQTANLTYGGLHETKEHQFITQNETIRQALLDLFEADRSKGTNPTQRTPLQLPANLLVCPFNCRSGVEKLISEAQTSITIRNQYITDPSIERIIKQQQYNGLQLQLLVSDNDNNADLMRYFDHDTARQVSKPYMHTKTMLIDDTYLVIGSINFSTNSMDNNREVAIIITDPSIIQQRKQDFAYYRAQG